MAKMDAPAHYEKGKTSRGVSALRKRPKIPTEVRRTVRTIGTLLKKAPQHPRKAVIMTKADPAMTVVVPIQ